MPVSKLRINRKAYTRSDGTRVKATTYLSRDQGAKGRTPKSQQWYRPKVTTGWRAEMPSTERRRLVLAAHKGDYLSSARAMLALSNVLQRTSPGASRTARADADYFFGKHKKGG